MKGIKVDNLIWNQSSSTVMTHPVQNLLQFESWDFLIPRDQKSLRLCSSQYSTVYLYEQSFPLI